MMRNLFFTMIVFALAGCGTQQRIVEVPVPMVTHDTLRTVIERIDSIHVTDSVVVKGDTVDRWHTRYVQRILRDTVWQHRVDTVTVVETVTVEVEKKGVSWLEWIGLGAIVAVMVWAVIKLRR